MKTTLFTILWKKEKFHWRRMKELFKKSNSWLVKLSINLIIAMIITIFHYAFALMHTLYEIVLFIFARDLFKSNLQKLALKV
jgi:hypothetical protein